MMRITYHKFIVCIVLCLFAGAIASPTMAYFIPPADTGGNILPVDPIAPPPPSGDVTYVVDDTSSGNSPSFDPSSLIQPINPIAPLAPTGSPSTSSGEITWVINAPAPYKISQGASSTGNLNTGRFESYSSPVTAGPVSNSSENLPIYRIGPKVPVMTADNWAKDTVYSPDYSIVRTIKTGFGTFTMPDKKSTMQGPNNPNGPLVPNLAGKSPGEVVNTIRNHDAMFEGKSLVSSTNGPNFFDNPSNANPNKHSNSSFNVLGASGGPKGFGTIPSSREGSNVAGDNGDGDNTGKEATQAVSGIAGFMIGGIGGAEAGIISGAALCGAAGPVGVAVCGIAGGLIGGISGGLGGYKTGSSVGGASYNVISGQSTSKDITTLVQYVPKPKPNQPVDDSIPYKKVTTPPSKLQSLAGLSNYVPGSLGDEFVGNSQADKYIANMQLAKKDIITYNAPTKTGGSAYVEGGTLDPDNIGKYTIPTGQQVDTDSWYWTEGPGKYIRRPANT